MSRPRLEGLLRKGLALGFLTFALAISLYQPQNRAQAQYGCPASSYDYCDANYGMWVNPYTCACAPYCSLAEPDCTNIGGTLDYDNCRCIMPPIMFNPCDDYSASIFCGGDPFNQAFSGISWVYGTGYCNPAWANSCAAAGGTFNYNTCLCDLGTAIGTCPNAAAASATCLANGGVSFNSQTCTCKYQN